MNDIEEAEFLERISEGTDEDWADFWSKEDPTEFIMNDRKLEEVNG